MGRADLDPLFEPSLEKNDAFNEGVQSESRCLDQDEGGLKDGDLGAGMEMLRGLFLRLLRGSGMSLLMARGVDDSGGVRLA